jgi:hypothetical protein
MDRATDYESVGRAFESPWARQGNKRANQKTASPSCCWGSVDIFILPLLFVLLFSLWLRRPLLYCYTLQCKNKQYGCPNNSY